MLVVVAVRPGGTRGARVVETRAEVVEAAAGMALLHKYRPAHPHLRPAHRRVAAPQVLCRTRIRAPSHTRGRFLCMCCRARVALRDASFAMLAIQGSPVHSQHGKGTQR